MKNLAFIFLRIFLIYVPLAQTKGQSAVISMGHMVIKGEIAIDESVANIFIGDSVGLPIFHGLAQNLAVGHAAGSLGSLMKNSTFFGYRAGQTNLANDNTFIGATCGLTNLDGAANVYLGHRVGSVGKSDSRNACAGALIGSSYPIGFGNSYFGAEASSKADSVISNVAVGYRSGFYNRDGQFNTLVGNWAGFSVRGDYNTAVGYFAGGNYEGAGNTYFGVNAGLNNRSGEGNTFAGASSGFSSSVAEYNTMIGQEAGFNNISGSSNTFVGHESARENSSGYQNVMIGHQAGFWNKTGPNNVYLGTRAGFGNTIDSTSEGNTYVGVGAGENTNGLLNTLVGKGANASLGLLNATAIGHNASVNSSHKIRVGNDQVTIIEGQVDFSNVSDLRLKENIQVANLGLAFIRQLRPVKYHLKRDKTTKLFTGLIAQEVELASQNFDHEFSAVRKPVSDDDYYSLVYSDIVMPLIKAIQELNVRILEIKSEIDRFELRQELNTH